VKHGNGMLVHITADDRLQGAGEKIGGGENDADHRRIEAKGHQIGDGKGTGAGHGKEIRRLMKAIQRREIARALRIAHEDSPDNVMNG